MGDAATAMVLLTFLFLLAAASGGKLLTADDLAPLMAKTVVIPASKARTETDTPAAGPPRATPWPEEFTIAFTTKNGKARGLLVYDWGNKQQVIFHGPGSTYCLNHGTAAACRVVENPAGSFAVIPSARRCVLESPGVGSVPPDWVVQGVFAGAVDVGIDGAGVACNRFTFPPTMHEWLETVDGGLPCAFVFPDPDMTFYFAPRSLKLGVPDADLFKLPEYCPDAAEATLKADH